MKKLLVFIYILYLTSVVVSSQETYRLEKVELTVWDYKSKSPVFVKSLNDSLQVVTSEWDFPVLPVFSLVDFTEDSINWVKLLGDDNKYIVDSEENILLLSEIQDPQKNIAETSPEEEKVPETFNGFQFPPYTVQQSGNRLKIIFDNVIYGSSNYPRQTLEGKCEMIYVKP